MMYTDHKLCQAESGGMTIRSRARILILILVMAILMGITLLPAGRDTFLGLLGINTVPAPNFIASQRYGMEIFQRAGRSYLYGGDSFDDHFDITEFRLQFDQLRYGLGREWFPALIEPDFISLEEADETFRDEARMLVAKVGPEVHVYPLDTVKEYEVVNDRVGGIPIFAAYCFLAELGAVYDRRYGEHELTFAVSGYTYQDTQVWEGRNAFVLWDRNTESLWWPPIGRAVSGPMVDQPLRLLDESMWAQTSWGEIKQKYPEAVVLKSEQSFSPPVGWPMLDVILSSEGGDVNQIAPRWGGHDGLGGN